MTININEALGVPARNVTIWRLSVAAPSGTYGGNEVRTAKGARSEAEIVAGVVQAHNVHTQGVDDVTAGDVTVVEVVNPAA